MKSLTIQAFAALIFASISDAGRGAVVFSENFGVLADAADITTGNTTFTYVRDGTGTNISEIQSPGSFTGSSALLLSSSASLTGFGTSGLTAFDSGTFSFSLRTPSAFAGAADALFIGLGTGVTFTGNSTFVGAQLTAAYQILNGTLQTRTGTAASSAWTTLIALSASTSYDFSIVFNGSASNLTYEAGTLGAGTADLYLNGALITTAATNDIVDAVDVSGLRFYSVSGTVTGSGYELDNIVLQNVATIPESSSIWLSSLGVVALSRRRRCIPGIRSGSSVRTSTPFHA